jgi:hypothetical protein
LLPQASLIVPQHGETNVNLVTSVTGGNANQAYYQPFVMPYTTSLLSMSFSCSTGTNNHDMGIYQGTTRLVSRGPTASTAAAVNTWTLTNPLVLQEGVLYYAAWSTAGVKTIARLAGTSVLNPRLGRVIQTGLTAATLPATATFAAPGADVLVPLLKLTFSY